MGWTKHITDEAELAGMPESAMAAAKANAEAEGLRRFVTDSGNAILHSSDDVL